MSELNLKKLFEANEGAEEDLAGDGQPRQHFYAPSVMVARDVIENILDKFTAKAGVTHSFSHDDLILRVSVYSRDLNGVDDDLKQQLSDVVKFLKDEYKGITGKALKIGEPEHQDFNVVSNYTTNRLALCTLTCSYELPESKAGEDASAEKGDVPGNIPNVKPKNK